ncbi:RNA ligase family protein [Nocardia rhizosphaerae]|uniref:RNA ligase family protein n=1 Tax=Nocardia rhizosphaerae TaxID=1691571 RepID=A0ABV8LDR2_9NOCA
MALKPPANLNYAAVVARLTAVNELAGCDNIAGAPLLGFQAIVGKDQQPGDLGIVFVAESQLSEEFAQTNNLHREPELNADPAEKGYLERNRRVRAIKLRGHRSDALFMPLEALAYTGYDIAKLAPGDVFDELNGHEICRKFERPVKGGNARTPQAKATKKFVRVDAKFLPEHYDTTRYWGNEHLIDAEARVVITQKLHGTSIRIGNTIAKRKPTWRDKLAARFLKVPVAEYIYDTVYGSRKVIKDPKAEQNHFYGSDVWTHYGKRLDGLIPQSFVVYAELIGWTPEGAPIQSGYTYNVPQGEADLYVYRVAHVNPQGIITDLAWGQLVEWCAQLGLKTVPVLTEMAHKAFDPADWLDRRYYDEGYGQAVPLSGSKKLVDEGVCVRTVDGLHPTTLKAKSPIFLQHETKALDDEKSVDLEAEGGIAA